MKPLALIAGIGGINAAGRSSAHHGYRRTVIDVLDQELAAGTMRSLAALMGIHGTIDAERRSYILEHTLLRGLEPGILDPGNVAWNCRARLTPGHGPVSFVLAQRDLPEDPDTPGRSRSRSSPPATHSARSASGGTR